MKRLLSFIAFGPATMAAVLALGDCANLARADTLVGDTISGQYFFPNLATPCCGDVSWSPSQFTVGLGIDTTLTAAGVPFSIDFSASSLTIGIGGTITFRSDRVFNGPVFSILTGNNFG